MRKVSTMTDLSRRGMMKFGAVLASATAAGKLGVQHASAAVESQVAPVTTKRKAPAFRTSTQFAK
jgi:hypothetical protein